MTATQSREIRFAKVPTGLPDDSTFELASVPVPTPGDNEFVIRNVVMSVDPYMRGRMMVARDSYVPAFRLGAPMEGGVVGEVIASNNSRFAVGSYVSHMLGWREYALSSGAGVMPVDPAVPLSAYLGVLGMPGMTAYAGLNLFGLPKEGETVFVSAAAGAVGSLVCQLAKLKGCKVVGSAGSDDKVAYLIDELGCDAAFNYKTVGDLTKALAQAAPQGIDIYFDNVGGAHLVAALNVIKPFGRIPVCGMIDQYNAAGEVVGPNNLINVIPKRLAIRGFIVSDHFDLMPQFMADVAPLVVAGKIKWRETVYHGIDQAPTAFLGLFKGDNMGKAVVRLGPDKA